MKGHIGILLELGKVRISLLATISMIAGYVLAYGGVSWMLVFGFSFTVSWPEAPGVAADTSKNRAAAMDNARDMLTTLLRFNGFICTCSRFAVSERTSVTMA